jgi:hypothetical protein
MANQSDSQACLGMERVLGRKQRQIESEKIRQNVVVLAVRLLKNFFHSLCVGVFVCYRFDESKKNVTPPRRGALEN